MVVLPEEAVLKISNPLAGDVMGDAEFAAIKAILGGKKPLSVAAISSLAEAFGFVVPIPVCAKLKELKNNHTKYIFFILSNINFHSC